MDEYLFLKKILSDCVDEYLIYVITNYEIMIQARQQTLEAFLLVIYNFPYPPKHPRIDAVVADGESLPESKEKEKSSPMHPHLLPERIV